MRVTTSHIVFLIGGILLTYAVMRGIHLHEKSQQEERAFPRQSHSQVMQDIYALSPVKQADIVMLGDSLTERFPWAEITGCKNLVNRGIGGETSQDILNRLASIQALQPKIVFVMAGTNDVMQDIDPQVTVTNLKAIAAQLPAVIVKTPPLYSQGHLVETSSVGRTVFYDLNNSSYEDGVHLTAKAYQQWLEGIQKELKSYCKS